MRIFFWLTFFSIAMGYFEAAVVIYLRIIYYPDGFHFPLVNLNPSVALVELGRELATLIMLIGIAKVSGKNGIQRFAWFLYCFAVWDIFYYVFLKILLNWPESLLTWDILFLIPLPWIGPVLAPLLLSSTMVLLAFLLLFFNDKNPALRIRLAEWILFISGSLIVIISFIRDCYHYLNASQSGMLDALSGYTPSPFDWWVFCAGETLILGAAGLFCIRAKRLLSRKS